MVDQLSPEQRSAFMAGIRGKDTKPERVVRRLLHRLGYRFRLHDRSLPGRPDIVFKKRRKAIFVHGCFWHNHGSCNAGRLPKTREDYWRKKFEGNKARDERQQILMQEQGWQVLVVWECETRKVDEMQAQLLTFLGPPRPGSGHVTRSQKSDEP